MTHALKTYPVFYQDIENESKTFELRKDDRPFKVGDTILLQEYDGDKKQYTGKETKRIITYILRSVPIFGLKPGFVILGLKND